MSEKKSRAVPVWLSDSRIKELDSEIEIELRGAPAGASLSRSAWIGAVVERVIAERRKERERVK